MFPFSVGLLHIRLLSLVILRLERNVSNGSFCFHCKMVFFHLVDQGRMRNFKALGRLSLAAALNQHIGDHIFFVCSNQGLQVASPRILVQSALDGTGSDRAQLMAEKD